MSLSGRIYITPPSQPSPSKGGRGYGAMAPTKSPPPLRGRVRVGGATHRLGLGILVRWHPQSPVNSARIRPRRTHSARHISHPPTPALPLDGGREVFDRWGEEFDRWGEDFGRWAEAFDRWDEIFGGRGYGPMARNKLLSKSPTKSPPPLRGRVRVGGATHRLGLGILDRWHPQSPVNSARIRPRRRSGSGTGSAPGSWTGSGSGGKRPSETMWWISSAPRRSSWLSWTAGSMINRAMRTRCGRLGWRAKATRLCDFGIMRCLRIWTGFWRGCAVPSVEVSAPHPSPPPPRGREEFYCGECGSTACTRAKINHISIWTNTLTI